MLLKSDINTVIEDTRLHLHSEFSFLGASADGKVIETLPDDSTNIGCLEIKCLFPFLENPSWNPPLNSLQKNIRMRFAWLLLLRMGGPTCERITGTLTLNDIYLHNSFHFLHPVCVLSCTFIALLVLYVQ